MESFLLDDLKKVTKNCLFDYIVFSYDFNSFEVSKLFTSDKFHTIFTSLKSSNDVNFSLDFLVNNFHKTKEEIIDLFKSLIESKENVIIPFYTTNDNGYNTWYQANIKLKGTIDSKYIFMASIINVSFSTKQYETITNATKRIIFVCSKKEKNILYGNTNFLKWINYDHNTNFNKSLKDNILPLDLDVDSLQIDKEVLIYSENDDSYYEVICHNVDWSGIDSLAIYLSDVTKKKKEEEKFLDVQEQRIKSTLNSKNVIWVLKVNLTKDITEGFTDILLNKNYYSKAVCYSEKMVTATKKMINNNHKQEYLSKFDRDSLLNNYYNGVNYVDFEYDCIDDDKNQTVHKMTMSLYTNPYTGDVEGIFLLEDIKEEYLCDLVLEFVSQKEYDDILIIDSNFNNVTQVTLSTKGKRVAKTIGYEEYILNSANNYIKKDEIEEYISLTNKNHVMNELDKRGEHIFNIHVLDESGMCNLKKYTFNYLKDNKIILSIVDIKDSLERDNLTGLLNYHGFLNYASQILNDVENPNDYAILFYNIRGFKGINHLRGNLYGDELLKYIRDRLSNSSLQPILLARYTVSDHFLMLVRKTNITNDELSRICHFDFSHIGIKQTIYCRCGIYYIYNNELPVKTMCDCARMAEKHILDDYTQPFSTFTQEMRNEYLVKTEALSILDSALENGEFKVYYQPIYDPRTGKIVSAEALIRWIRPEKGFLSPAQFIPAFEENGYITKVDHYVASSVCQFLLERSSKNKFCVPVSINLSWMDFFDSNMVDSINSFAILLKNHNLVPRFEVTETSWAAVTKNDNGAVEFFRELGSKILLDDFGSGYSSFSTITNYDFDIIKLDMGFVQKIGNNNKIGSIIHSIIDMAHHMNLKVIAEGAETKEQVDFLVKHNCDFIQGYYFSKPLPKEDFELLLDGGMVA